MSSPIKAKYIWSLKNKSIVRLIGQKSTGEKLCQLTRRDMEVTTKENDKIFIFKVRQNNIHNEKRC